MTNVRRGGSEEKILILLMTELPELVQKALRFILTIS